MGSSPCRKALKKLESRNKSALIAAIIIIIILTGLKLYETYNQASSLQGYVSDEIWYVPSARLIANNLLGLKTTYEYAEGQYGYSVLLKDQADVLACKLKVQLYGGEIIKDDYIKNTAIAVALPNGTLPENVCEGVMKVVPGYPMPDNENVFDYVNPEHPPIGKYIIAIFMSILGDRPIIWRLPGVIEAGLLVVIAGLAGWKLFGLLGAAISSAVASFDPLTKNMGSVAMLDIHLAFFTALGILFYIYNRPILSLSFISLSGLVKYSGFFLIPFIFIYLWKEGRLRLRAAIYVLAFPLAFAAIVFMPYIFHYGISWVIQQFMFALSWHTESRPPGPPTSTPIEWILGWSPFYLSYNPDIPASGSPIIYVPVFVASLISFPLYFIEKERPGNELKTYGVFLSILIFLFMYTLLYIIGNKTLYSFYFTQITPAFYYSFVGSMLVIAGCFPSLSELIELVKGFLKANPSK